MVERESFTVTIHTLILHEEELHIAIPDVTLVKLLDRHASVALGGECDESFSTWTPVVSTLDPHLIVPNLIATEEIDDLGHGDVIG